jgi:protoheme IX farnesyltransferase
MRSFKITHIRDYIALTKPGIVRGNVLVAIGGFFLASTIGVDWAILFAVTIGLTCVIASACVVNNYFDRKIDAKMDRTKNRALVTGSISSVSALWFACVLGGVGFGTLLKYTNFISFFWAVVGFISYTIAYTPLKKKTVFATEIGSIPGGTPPIIGYTAVAGTFDQTALLLGLILIAWQMPHFFSISIFRKKEYRQASIPVRAIHDGSERTRTIIQIYVIAFSILCVLLFSTGVVGWSYLTIMSTLCGYWLFWALRPPKHNIENWAKGVFGISLIVLLGFCIAISVGARLP